MTKIKDFIKEFKWWDWLFLLFSIAGILTFSILFKPNFAIVLNSVFGILTALFIAKGFLISNFLGIIQLVFYCIMCFTNKYYGEIFVAFAVSLPTFILSIITWHKNRSNKAGVVRVSNKVTLKEFFLTLGIFAILAVGFYFILGAFGTNQLLLSTLSVYFAFLYSYFSVQRSELNFIFRILCDLISLGLWIAVFVAGDKLNWAYTITIFNYLLFTITDFLGIYNWSRMKKKQAKTKNGIEKEIWDALKDLD